MTLSPSGKDMIRLTEAIVLGKTVREGSTIVYEERTKCPCCRKGELCKEITASITGIEVYPGTGFAEVGDDMIMYLDNGHMLRGDSENGFWSIKRVAS